jgi:cell division protein FtsQ
LGRRNRKRKSPEQRRDDRRRRVNHWLLAPLRLVLLAVLGVGLGVGAWQVAVFLRTSQALSVRAIEVSGTSRTHLDELLRAADLYEGINIFGVDRPQVRKRLEEHPWVKRASVQRVVPDRIEIEIEEHRPAALISLEGLYLVSDEGVVFKRLQAGEALDLPIITGIERRWVNSEPEQVRLRLREALKLIYRVERTACLAGHELAELQLDELLGVSLVLDPGALTVRMGLVAPETRLGTLCRLFEALADRDLRAHTIYLDQDGSAGRATVRLDRRSPMTINQSEQI